ncbi:hypothetical protein KY289_030293 [Solanum tuberosum]|nr:hypothetical protein KY289_030293 [Solanum tuberosum]
MMVFAANCATNQAPANSWIVDSGASHHITAEPHNLLAYNGMEHVSMGDGPEHRDSFSPRSE